MCLRLGQGEFAGGNQIIGMRAVLDL